MGIKYVITGKLASHAPQPSNKKIKIVLELLGIESVTVVTEEQTICDWVTASSLTDHAVVKCLGNATHWINDPDESSISYTCLPHADLYREITKRMPNKIDRAVADQNSGISHSETGG